MAFTREELQSIRDRALEDAKRHGPGDLMAMRAYADLAAAADRLDAMAARARPVAIASNTRVQPQYAAPRTSREVAASIELEDAVDEDGNPVEMYDPSNG